MEIDWVSWIQLSTTWKPLAFQLPTNWRPLDCHSTSTRHPLNILFSTWLFWSWNMEQQCVGFDTPLFHITRANQPRVNIYVHSPSTQHPLNIHSTSSQHQIDIHLISTGHPNKIQLKSTWHPFNDRFTTNWPTLHNPWFDIGFVVKWNSLIGILFSTGLFWSCNMEQQWVKFDSPLFRITRPKQPRVRFDTPLFHITRPKQPCVNIYIVLWNNSESDLTQPCSV